MPRRETPQIKKQVGKRPTIHELTERIKRRSRVPVKGSSATVIRRHRDAG